MPTTKKEGKQRQTKMYSLNKDEQKLISDIKRSYYMSPILAGIDEFVAAHGDTDKTWINAFDQIYNVLTNAKNAVDAILEKRRESGKIKDVSQARKSVAGNAFSSAIVYIFLQNKIRGNIKPGVFMTSRKSQVKGFDKITTIHVGGETQKPDCDLVIYTKTADGQADRCMILSLKTSLRERAGQTYKWKMLLEIASTENVIKERYDISYPVEKMPLIGFATVNFYSEINNPQHRGMFKFFDKSFVAKPEGGGDLVVPLSRMVEYVNQKL